MLAKWQALTDADVIGHVGHRLLAAADAVEEVLHVAQILGRQAAAVNLGHQLLDLLLGLGIGVDLFDRLAGQTVRG